MSPAPIDDLVLDLSHYDLPTFDAQCLYDAGVRRVIIGCYQPSTARRMVLECQAVGIEVTGLYGLVYFGNSPYYVNRDTDNAIAIARELGLPMSIRMCPDAEIDAAGIGVDVPPSYPAQRRQQLLAVCEKLESFGYEQVIPYTGKWWEGHIDDWAPFAHYLFWLAAYGVPPVQHATMGGHPVKLWLHQYTSTRVICGRGRDHNYLFEEDDDMAGFEERLALLERLNGGWGLDAVAPPAGSWAWEQVGSMFPPGTPPGAVVRMTGATALMYADKLNMSWSLGLSGLNASLTDIQDALRVLGDSVKAGGLTTPEAEQLFKALLDKARIEIRWATTPPPVADVMGRIAELRAGLQDPAPGDAP
ncbi:MAG: hypothetical protein ACSLE9_07930 [Burkholderiaceae bacterium]